MCVGHFQERNLFCAKRMVVGDPLPSIPVYGNICLCILVSGTEFTAAALSRALLVAGWGRISKIHISYIVVGFGEL